MKNGFIVVLLLAVGFLFYQNGKLKSGLNTTQKNLETTQESVSQVQSRMAQQAVQMAAVNSAAQNKPVPTASPALSAGQATSLSVEQSRLAELVQEQKQLQQQIQDNTPQNLNAMIQQKNGDLTALQNQMKNYQSNERNVEQTASTALQFQRTLNQQTQTLLTQRIRSQERAIRTTRRELMLMGQTPNLDGDDRFNALNAQLAQQQLELQNMQAQKEGVANQAVEQTTNLGDQMSNSKAMLANTQAAVQRQMQMIQQDISSLEQQKAQAQNTTAIYKQELSQLNQAISAQQKTVNQLKKGSNQ